MASRHRSPHRWSQKDSGVAALLTCFKESSVGCSAKPMLFCPSEARRGRNSVDKPRHPCSQSPPPAPGDWTHQGQPLPQDVPCARGHEGLEGMPESEQISLATKVLCSSNVYYLNLSGTR